MHESVMQFVERVLPAELVTGRSVLEVGSYNVNGSVRSILEPLNPSRYIGVDMREGPGVDLVCKAEDLDPQELYSDIVVCAEMLEHAEHWVEAMGSMIDCCGSLFVMTARGPGFPLHDYPSDYWRFTLPVVQEACDYFGINVLSLAQDWQAPGFHLIADCSGLTELSLDREIAAPPVAMTVQEALKFVGLPRPR